MKLTTFLCKHSYSPIDLHEAAELAKKVTDHPALKKAANNYLQALRDFEDSLEAVGFEFG